MFWGPSGLWVRGDGVCGKTYLFWRLVLLCTPILKALLCSCSHCFALSCCRDGEAVYSIVLGWESWREKCYIQDGVKWKILHWGYEGIWDLVCWSKLVYSVLDLKLIQNQKWSFFPKLSLVKSSQTRWDQSQKYLKNSWVSKGFKIMGLIFYRMSYEALEWSCLNLLPWSSLLNPDFSLAQPDVIFIFKPNIA